MDIPKLLTESFNDIISNPKALLPTFLLSAIIIVLIAITIILFYSQTILPSINLFISAPTTFFNGQQFPVILKILLEIILVFTVLLFFMGILLNGIIVAIGKQLANKEKLNLTIAFRLVESRYLKLLGGGFLSMLIMLLILGLPLLFVLFLLVSYLSISVILLSMIILLILFLFYIVFSIYLYQVTAVIIIENKGPIAAIQRSFEIASKNRINIFILLVLISLISGFTSFIIDFLIIVPFLGIVIGIIINIFISVWFGIIPAYFYYTINSVKKPTDIKIKKTAIKTPAKTTTNGKSQKNI